MTPINTDGSAPIGMSIAFLVHEFAERAELSSVSLGVTAHLSVVNYVDALEPLYRMVFGYPHGWSVALASDGTEGQHLFLAEGRCDGRISGPMRERTTLVAGETARSARTSTG